MSGSSHLRCNMRIIHSKGGDGYINTGSFALSIGNVCVHRVNIEGWLTKKCTFCHHLLISNLNEFFMW